MGFITAATTVQADRVHNDCVRPVPTTYGGVYMANADGTCPNITIQWCGSDFSDQPRFQSPADVGHFELYDRDGVLVHDFGFITTSQLGSYAIPGSWFQDGSGQARLGAWHLRCRQPTSGELAAHPGADVTATADALFGRDQGMTSIVLVPHNTVMPAPPVDTPPAGGVAPAYFALVGQAQRVGVSLHHPVNTPDSYHAGNAAAIAQMVTWFKGYDTARTRPDGMPAKLICLSFDDFRNTTADVASVRAIVARTEYIDVDLFICTNEIQPDGSGQGGVLSASNLAQQRAFYGAVKAGRADAARATNLVGSATSVVSGPSATGLINGYLAAAGATVPGSATGFDILVVHDYPGAEGSAGYQDDYYGAFANLNWDGPIFSDESTGSGAAEYGGGYPNRQRRRASWLLRARAKWGLPPEWTCYFAGFAGFPWWTGAGASFLAIGGDNGHPGAYPVVGSWYVHRLALWGTSQIPEAVLELADPDDNHLVHACVYRKTTGGAQPAPTSNAGVVDLQTLGDPDMALQLQLGGTVPSTVTVWTGDGKPVTATVTGGRVTIDRTLLGGDGLMDGAYVFLPGGCTATAVLDPDTFQKISGVDINISTNAGTGGVTGIVNTLRPEGALKNALVYDVPNTSTSVSPWRFGVLLHDGDTRSITFTPAAGVKRLRRVRLTFLPPWQAQSTATRFNVVGIRNGVETVLAEVDTDPASKVLDWRTDAAGYQSWHLTFFNDQHVFTVHTSATIDAFRVDILDATYGGAPTMNAATGFGRTATLSRNALDIVDAPNQYPPVARDAETWTGVDPAYPSVVLDENLLGAGFAAARRPSLQRVTVLAEAASPPPPSGALRYLVLGPPISTLPGARVAPLVEEFL